MDVWVYGFMGVLVYGYECIGAGNVTPLPAHRAPVLHTIQLLTSAKRAAMQTRRTEPLTAPHFFGHLGARLCRVGLALPVWRRVYTSVRGS